MYQNFRNQKQEGKKLSCEQDRNPDIMLQKISG
jgi:hypothetical protein